VPVAAPLTYNIAAIILGGTLLFAVALLTATAIGKNFRASVIDEQALADQPPPLPDPEKVATWWCRPLDWVGLALITGIFSLFGFSQILAGKDAVLEKITPMLVITNIIIVAFLVTMVLGMVAWRVRPVQWLGLRWKQWYWALLIGPSAVILMWTVLGLLNWCGYIAWMENLIGESSVQDAVKMLREGNDGLTVGLMALSAVLVAPLAEEVIFRGYIYPVAKKFSNVRIGMLFSALIFSLGHGNIPLLLPLFLLGLILAAAYEWTGSLWASISVHLCFNAATVAIQIAIRAGLLNIPEQMQ
jgi:membrane protease YdiL (CAAX protease family)